MIAIATSGILWSQAAGKTPAASISLRAVFRTRQILSYGTYPTSPEVLRYEATIEDPKVFTRPWKISFPLYRRLDKGAQFMEFKCVPFSEEFIYGHLRKQAGK